LEEVVAAERVDILPGDILLVRTGWFGFWLQSFPEQLDMQPPGLSEDTIPWLARHDVAMVAADNSSVEFFDRFHPRVPFHIRAIRDLGMLLGEWFDLDDLAEHSADRGTYECMLVAQPLPVVNSVGSPLNPLALM
jgi:kynurenine formamidase